MRLLVAGASGVVGRHVVALAKARGDWVRAVSRSASRAPAAADERILVDATQPGKLYGACDGVDAVISCLGASAALQLAGWRPYGSVDVPANAHLIEEARRARVARIVYVSVHVAPGYARTAYVRAHEKVADALRASGLACSIVRPTGIFPSFDPFLRIARWGFLPIIGGGQARSNPVHPEDVASACLDALAGEPRDSSIGGPETLTREEVARLVFRVLGGKARLVHVPGALARLGAWSLWPLHPRVSELSSFAVGAMTTDCVAPAIGAKRLEDWFRGRVENRARAE